MTFHVDDRFYGSDPVLAIPPDLRPAVIGLWCLAGSWSAGFKKDGWVPNHMVEHFGSVELAEHLRRVKLWRKRGAGYVFVDWEKWQETREESEARRKKWREQKAGQRATKPEAQEISGDVRADNEGSLATPYPYPSPSPKDDDKMIPPDRVTYESQHTRESYPQAGDGSVGFDVDRVIDALLDVNPDLDPAFRSDLTDRADLAGRAILGRAKRAVQNPTGYITASIRKHADGWRQFTIEGKVP